MNPNSKQRILWRKTNQRVRRLALRLCKSKRQKLLDAKRRIATKETLTDIERAKLGRLNWLLGSGSLYRFTPKQAKEQAAIARAILDEEGE